MSCTLCAGYGGSCPVCEEEPKMITCPECNGEGMFYYVGEELVDKQTYDKVKLLVPKACGSIKCESCDGEGKIEEEPYEPDPDEYYDRKREEELL